MTCAHSASLCDLICNSYKYVNIFRPDLIDYDSLEPSNIHRNCSLAFDAAHLLGVTKIISPSDMVVLAIPDKIAVMTYVSLLRDVFTGQHLTHSVRLSGIFQPSLKVVPSPTTTQNQAFAISNENVNDSSQKEQAKISNEPSSDNKSNLMTRNQLMNPFDSDDESSDKRTNSIKTIDSSIVTPTAAPPAAPPALSNKTMKLLEQYEKSKPLNGADGNISAEAEQRQQILKERARKLIEETKNSAVYPNTIVTTTKTIKMSEIVRPVKITSKLKSIL